MKVLVACECSGIVRDAFRAQGHDAWSCDVQPAEDGSAYHYADDALTVMRADWDLLIAHPPCTYLANSGVRWLHEDETRWQKMWDAVDFFYAFHDAASRIPMVCVENPIPHFHANLPRYTQCIQPWMFGDNYSKATCLWLHGLPPLVPEVLTKPADVQQACWLEPPGPERQKNRSRTYPGIARAMAEQWGTDWQPPMELVA